MRQSQRKVENYQEKYVEDASTPDWAHGCGKCKYGLVDTPAPIHIPAPWYAARAAQAKVGVLHFCTCDAGVRYRNFLLRHYLDIKYKRDPFPQWEEIENAAATPTVHYEGEE